jgi:hypothetical protein
MDHGSSMAPKLAEIALLQLSDAGAKDPSFHPKVQFNIS